MLSGCTAYPRTKPRESPQSARVVPDALTVNIFWRSCRFDRPQLSSIHEEIRASDSDSCKKNVYFSYITLMCSSSFFDAPLAITFLSAYSDTPFLLGSTSQYASVANRVHGPKKRKSTSCMSSAPNTQIRNRTVSGLQQRCIGGGSGQTVATLHRGARDY